MSAAKTILLLYDYEGIKQKHYFWHKLEELFSCRRYRRSTSVYLNKMDVHLLKCVRHVNCFGVKSTNISNHFFIVEKLED